MEYDPVKDRFGNMVAGRYWPTRLFFALLHLFFLRAWYVRRALKSVVGRRKTPIHMLDAGTGFGQFAFWVANKFPQVTLHAIDIKEDYVDRAQAFFAQAALSSRAEFSVDDLTNLKAEGPFDLILSVDVMEHILEDVMVFEHFHRVLAPGGSVIINTPSDQGGSDSHGESGDSFIGEHVRDGYGKQEIRDKLEGAGFEVDSARYTYGRFGSMAWRISIKWPMLMLNASFAFVVVLPFYYALSLPLTLVLNALDVSSENHTGTGLIVVAHRA